MTQDVSASSKPQPKDHRTQDQDALGSWRGIWNTNWLLRQMTKKKKEKNDMARDRALAQLGPKSWKSWGQDLGTARDKILE